MSSYAESQYLANGIVREFRGQSIQATSPATPLAVWPAAASTGRRAAQAVVRAMSGSAWMSLDAPNAGEPGGELRPDLEYVFAIAPQVQTMYFYAPTSTTVLVRWLVI